MTWYRPNYILRLSPLGTARITFTDGTTITLMRQTSAAQALRTAWRLKKAAFLGSDPARRLAAHHPAACTSPETPVLAPFASGANTQ